MLVKVAWVLCAGCAVGASSSQRKYDGSTLSYDPKVPYLWVASAPKKQQPSQKFLELPSMHRSCFTHRMLVHFPQIRPPTRNIPYPSN